MRKPKKSLHGEYYIIEQIFACEFNLEPLLCPKCFRIEYTSYNQYSGNASCEYCGKSWDKTTNPEIIEHRDKTF